MVGLEVNLSRDELLMLIEALDAYEYWQLGETLPRNNGEVFIPGDLPPDEDRYWGPRPDVTEMELEVIEGCAPAERLPTASEQLSRVENDTWRDPELPTARRLRQRFGEPSPRSLTVSVGPGAGSLEAHGATVGAQATAAAKDW